MQICSYQEAKDRFLSGDVSVKDFFKQNGFMLEYGYCLLLCGDSSGAKEIFSKLAKQDFRADWANKLIQFVHGYVTIVPSYFQIRNFLEIDLNLLIRAGQSEFVDYIINGADLFYSRNPESYKFISRVMLNNDCTEIALYYLNKAKDKFYNDPEMHFLMASCYLKEGEIALAKESAQNCLRVLPNYFPARRLLGKL